MANTVLDSDYTVATIIGQLRQSLPFSAQGDQVTLYYEQDYQQLLADWSPLAVNAVCPWDAAAYLVEESPLQKVLGGVVQWTRKYARVPVSRSDPSSIAFQFPGLNGAYLSDGSYFTVTLRVPQTWTVSCRIQMDYYLIGTGGSYATVTAVPTVQRQYFYYPLLNGILSISPGQGSDVTTLQSVHASAPTTPTVETYQGWMSAGTEFVAEASQLSRWKGNILQRATKYIVAR